MVMKKFVESGKLAPTEEYHRRLKAYNESISAKAQHPEIYNVTEQTGTTAFITSKFEEKNRPM